MKFFSDETEESRSALMRRDDDELWRAAAPPGV